MDKLRKTQKTTKAKENVKTPYECPICKSKLSSAAHLKRHMVTHDKARAKECPLCDYKSVRKDTMNRHLRTKHQKEPEVFKQASKQLHKQPSSRSVEKPKNKFGGNSGDAFLKNEREKIFCELYQAGDQTKRPKDIMDDEKLSFIERARLLSLYYLGEVSSEGLLVAPGIKESVVSAAETRWSSGGIMFRRGIYELVVFYSLNHRFTTDESEPSYETYRLAREYIKRKGRPPPWISDLYDSSYYTRLLHFL